MVVKTTLEQRRLIKRTKASRPGRERNQATSAGIKPIRSAKSVEEVTLISDALRSAIVASQKTHYALAKEAGIRPQMLDYFVRGEKSLQLATVDKLARVLALKLTFSIRQ